MSFETVPGEGLMNLQIALLAFATIFALPAAHADCNFGRNTWDLETKFEAPTAEHEFYQGETFSLSKPVRLGGLYPHEKQMIEAAMNAEAGDAATPEERLQEFSMTDGYLRYFSHAPSGRQFVQVAHFPGDNEYGTIFEIRVLPSGTEIVGAVAKIQDGDFTDCQF
jgi:hypothetical protein